MPVPKSILRMMRAIKEGRDLSDEDRATMHHYVERIDKAKMGRPTDAPLIRHRKQFAPVVEFEAMRVLGFKQEHAENDVMAQFNISKRSLWSYRRRVNEQFPGFRDAIRSYFRIVDKLGSDYKSVPLFQKLGFLWCRLLQTNIARPGIQIMMAEMVETNEAEKWIAILFDESLARARTAVVDALTPWPAALPKDAIEGLILTICAGVFDSVITTAIKSQISEWESR